MWQKDNTWVKYVKNIIASDIHSALFLATYVRQLSFNMNHCICLEIIDVNKYKIISNHKKVRSKLREISRTPFVFVVGKN